MAKKLLGRAVIKWNGRVLNTKKGSTIDLGGVSRESKTGALGVAGFSEGDNPAKVECEVYLGVGTSAAEVGRIDDATVTFEADTGQTYVISPAWVTETITISESDGTFKVTFEGRPAEEMS